MSIEMRVEARAGKKQRNTVIFHLRRQLVVGSVTSRINWTIARAVCWTNQFAMSEEQPAVGENNLLIIPLVVNRWEKKGHKYGCPFTPGTPWHFEPWDAMVSRGEQTMESRQLASRLRAPLSAFHFHANRVSNWYLSFADWFLNLSLSCTTERFALFDLP